MTTVQISPEAQLQETQAHVSHLQNRNFILAEKLKQSFEIGFGLERQVSELTARIAELEAAAMPSGQSEGFV